MGQSSSSGLEEWHALTATALLNMNVWATYDTLLVMLVVHGLGTPGHHAVINDTKRTLTFGYTVSPTSAVTSAPPTIPLPQHYPSFSVLDGQQSPRRPLNLIFVKPGLKVVVQTAAGRFLEYSHILRYPSDSIRMVQIKDANFRSITEDQLDREEKMRVEEEKKRVEEEKVRLEKENKRLEKERLEKALEEVNSLPVHTSKDPSKDPSKERETSRSLTQPLLK